VVSLHWGMYHRELFPRLVEGSWDGKTRYISTTGIHTSAITDSGIHSFLDLCKQVATFYTSQLQFIYA